MADMLEFVLTRPEMLALMFAVHARRIPLLDNERLIPDSQAAQTDLTQRGIGLLKQRGLLQGTGDIYTIQGDLGFMGAALAAPDTITVITRDAPGVGHQEFLHYRLDPVNVELTLPGEGEYRLAALPTLADALNRVRELLPPVPADPPPGLAGELEQAEFLRIKELAEGGETAEAARQLAVAGFLPETAGRFADALQHPVLGGTVTFVRIHEGEPADYRDLAVVTGWDGFWLIRSQGPQSPKLSVEAASPETYSAALLAALQSLYEAPAEGLRK